MTMQAKVVGSALIAMAITLTVVGLGSVTDLQNALLTAFLKDGVGSSVALVVAAWPHLLMPIAFCMAASNMLLLIAGLLVLTGQITFGTKNLKAEEELA